MVLGWSLGGTAALGLALRSAHPLHTILVAPGYAPRAIDAFSGLPLPEVFPRGDGSVDIFWGNRDELVDEAMARGLGGRLQDAGWAVTLTELDADHSGVVGIRFDEELDRYVLDPAARSAMEPLVAAVVAASRSS